MKKRLTQKLSDPHISSLETNYKELLQLKKVIKKKLKKFEDNFMVEHGRAPDLADKTVISHEANKLSTKIIIFSFFELNLVNLFVFVEMRRL